MVFEHLFSVDYLKKRPVFLFFLAIAYASIGIAGARLLFGANSGLVSVFFTSILLLPTLRKLFSEKSSEITKKYSIKKLYIKNKDMIWTYFAIFLGIFITYTLYSFLLPQFGFDTFNIFKEQLFVDPALRGKATFSFGMFTSIFSNNFWVLLACFILALFTGDGAIFFIAWNASSWGTIFGYRALTGALYNNANPLLYLILILVITFPHFFFESMAYILAAISGSKISKEIIDSKNAKKFLNVIGYSILILAFAYFLLTWVDFTYITIVTIILSLSLVYGIKTIFEKKKQKTIFFNSYYILLVAVIIFILGALIETIILGNSFTLNKIYNASYLYGLL